MKYITQSLFAHLRSQVGSCRQALKCVLLYFWDVYSAPTPAGRDILTQMFLCLSLGIITGGLLHHWLYKTLTYNYEVSIQITCIYSVAMFLVSFLCHPLRCVLTMILPTVSTKQGRKLLISLSVMILVLKVIPNITVNIGAVTHVIKCTAEGLAKTLLNSSEPLNEVKQDLVEEVIKVKGGDLNLVTNLRKLDHILHFNVSAVKSRLTQMTGQIEVNFSHAMNLLQECKLLSNRILAAIFVGLLIFESARYLKSYLTSVEFDNSYIPQELVKESNPAGNKKTAKNKINALICKIRSQECASCLISLAVVTLYFIAITLIVVLDHVVYHIVELILPWLMDFPPTSAGISVDYQVQGFFPFLCIVPKFCAHQELSSFHKDYKWTLSPEQWLCDVTTSAPDLGVTLVLGCLWLMSYCLVFFEVYARRLRRKISASFFRDQEERRMAYLMMKMQMKQEKKEQKQIFSFEVSSE
ncbi:Osteoclast stimulatory transmembrane protein [Channa argus]|uniref:Osteoclast stimulatory transmembrane protein n=1 Tax=Channa argus TaxID=215402 RepID=A0A6G1Q3Z4_CHAAH|nr:Osteoclast stimulatory transmembrane protein [Channa argus]KAK2897283.1 hypothetical protein Q8A73_013663 [Channa argus]